MSEWKDRISQWAEDRNLVSGSTPISQMRKLYEEVQELYEALYEGDRLETIDAIGDIQVVLGVICSQLHLDIDHCRECAWEEIKDRKGKMINGVFVKGEQ